LRDVFVQNVQRTKCICHNARLFLNRTYLNSKFEYLKKENCKSLKINNEKQIQHLKYTLCLLHSFKCGNTKAVLVYITSLH